MTNLVKQLLKDTRKYPKLLLPPGPPPSPNDLSDYWINNSPLFPIESSHRQNCVSIHFLLSSFIELDSNLLKNDFKKKSLFLPLNVLAPKLLNDKYLCFSFEDRLNFELESIGLNKSFTTISQKDDTFSNEIEKLKHQIDEIEPKLEETRKKLLLDLPIYRKDEDRRINEQEELQDLIFTINSKKKKK